MAYKFTRPDQFGEEADTFYDRQLKMLATAEKKRRTEPFWRIDDPILDADRKILVGGMWDYQRKIWLSPAPIKVLVGGYGCLVGDQEVYDPVAGVRRTVADLGELSTVSVDFDSLHLRINKSLAFPVGKKPCLEVSCWDGSTVKLTTDHPVLAKVHGHYEWVEAKYLTVESFVAVPRWLPSAGKIELSEFDIEYLVLDLESGKRLPSELYGVSAETATAILARIGEQFLGTPEQLRDIRHLCLLSNTDYSLNTNKGRIIPLHDTTDSDDVRFVLVKSITNIGEQEVFDLSVDDDHNFVCNNVIVHNSGKSNIGCKRIIALALENAPIPVATVSPTFSIARRTVVTQISEFLLAKQNHYGMAFSWRYNSAVHEFKIRFEGRDCLIQVLSGEDPLSLRGPNLAAAFMDEPFIQDKEVFLQLNARIRHPDSTRRELLLCGTPELTDAWGYELCSGTLKGFGDTCIVRASTRSNKALPPEYVPRLEGMLSEKAAKVYLDGYFINLSEGLVYYSFDAEDHVVDVAMPDGARLGAGMDFNVNPMAMTVFWEKDGHMHYIDEFELPNADTEYACQVLQEKYWRAGLREVFPDAAGRQRSTKAPGGKSDFHFIKEAGFEVRAKQSNPARKDRYNAVNGKLKSKSGRVSITISPKCEKLIKYLSTYSHELLNKQEAMSHLCFAGNTLVDTDQGFVRIDSIPFEGYVRTWNGAYTKYTNAGLISKSTSTVRVSLLNGESVICTPDHKWLTTEGWIEAKDLENKALVTWESQIAELPSKVEKFIRKHDVTHFVLLVEKVEFSDPKDVYCLNVPIHGCFTLSSGAIVSNCDSFSYPISYLFPIDRETLHVQSIKGI